MGPPKATVRFNGINAAIAQNGWSATSITAIVPASATTGPVLVRVGGKNSNSIPFTVGTEEVLYYHSDGIGSMRMVTGHQGYVVARHDYQPFGVEVLPPAGSQERVRFAGKEHDEETGGGAWQALDYFGARYCIVRVGGLRVWIRWSSQSRRRRIHSCGIDIHMFAIIRTGTSILMAGSSCPCHQNK